MVQRFGREIKSIAGLPQSGHKLSGLTVCFGAGCSIQEELFGSFEKLLTIADQKGVKYDRYVHSIADLLFQWPGPTLDESAPNCSCSMQICAGELWSGRATESQGQVQ